MTDDDLDPVLDAIASSLLAACSLSPTVEIVDDVLARAIDAVMRAHMRALGAAGFSTAPGRPGTPVAGFSPPVPPGPAET